MSSTLSKDDSICIAAQERKRSYNSTIDSSSPGSQLHLLKRHREGKLQYDPLDEAEEEIRVLTILPDDDGSCSVHCSLTHVSFKNSPMYAALSYCWGDPNYRRPITVNGYGVSVTTNLETALRELRRRGSTQVWIDALCINQDDEDERAHQILRMRQIYSAATETIAWLGPDEKAAARQGFAHLELLSRRTPLPQFHEAIRATPENTDEANLSAGWASFVALLGLPYWQRTWILQEVVVSSSLNIWWGQLACRLEHLIACVNTLLEHRSQTRKLADRKGFQNILGLIYLIEQYSASSQNSIGLLTALNYSCKSLTVDPRDKIFGILGLCVDGPDVVPSPDYRQPLETILREMTMRMVLDERSKNEPLDLICLRNPRVSDMHGLPSWVINWPSYWTQGRGNVWSSRTERGLCFEYRATAKSQKAVRFLDGGLTLASQGWVFDVVDTLSISPLSVDSVSPGNTRLTFGKSVYGSIDNVYEAIWRSLVMDRTDDLQVKAPAEYGYYFARLWSPEMEDVMCVQRSALFVSKVLIIGSFSVYGRPLKTWAEFMLPQMLAQHSKQIPNRSIGVEKHTESDRKASDSLEEFVYAIKLDEMDRRLIMTRKGYIGMAHPQSRVGDMVCLLPGCTVPVVLRKYDDGHRIIGEAYIHGIMNGEAWRVRDKSMVQTFFIK